MAEKKPNETPFRLRRASAAALAVIAGLASTNNALASRPSNSQETPTHEVAPPNLTAAEIKNLISRIKVRGNEQCHADTLAALQLLGHRAPDMLKQVAKYIGIIDCQPHGSAMYAYENPPRFQVGDAERKDGVYWYAATIVHDSMHSKLYHDYLASHKGESVPYLFWEGKEAENICITIQEKTLKRIGTPKYQLQYFLNYLEKERTSNYWDTPVSKRP